MSSFSSENDPTYFRFTDLHGFKDFLVSVIVDAPDQFSKMDWLAPDDQMNLERAFIGLRFGLDLITQEKGESEIVARCRSLVENAYAAYCAGDAMEGQRKLEEVEKLLEKIPTR